MLRAMQRRRAPRIVLVVALAAGVSAASVHAGAVDPVGVGIHPPTAVATGGTPTSAVSSYEAVGSEPRVVVVEAVVSGRMTRFDEKRDGVAIYDCCRAWYRAWVKPRMANQAVEVEVQYRQGGRWKVLLTDASTFSLGTDGSVVVSIDIGGGAGFAFRVRATWTGDDSNAGDPAPWVLFEFR
jgi:hypothetical protein